MIITISRQFGSGGRELGKRLADLLGYDYYDKEIIEAIAKNKKMDKDYVEKSLSSAYLKNIPVSFGRTIVPMYSNASTDLMVEERKIIEEIATQGKDFVIVGRNADVILEGYSPFNIFVCATMDARIDRCLSHMREGESSDRKAMEKSIKKIDKARIRTRTIVTEREWGDATSYHAVINTTGYDIKMLSQIACNFIKELNK
ncbi:MAG: cytidylate kinase-like family protein [Clostridia bacterium]|nr:cytidylate kinase-like family protein [Clostridia bacterium]